MTNKPLKTGFFDKLRDMKRMWQQRGLARHLDKCPFEISDSIMDADYMVSGGVDRHRFIQHLGNDTSFLLPWLERWGWKRKTDKSFFKRHFNIGRMLDDSIRDGYIEYTEGKPDSVVKGRPAGKMKVSPLGARLICEEFWLLLADKSMNFVSILIILGAGFLFGKLAILGWNMISKTELIENILQKI